jgi:hypothetical protein
VTPRVSRTWLGLAVGLFLADLALHLPITDFCDWLAKRYGFFEYDAATKLAFVAAGALAFLVLWFWPSPGRARTRVAIAAIAILMVAAQKLLLVAAVENIHYPQYALLAGTLVRSGLGFESSWLLAGGFGVLDELYQNAVLPRGVPGYLDANDIVLNAIGAAAGVVIADWKIMRRAGRTLLSSRAAAAVGFTLLTTAATLGPLVASPFYRFTPGGRRFHLLSPFEASVMLCALWSGVRLLASRQVPLTSSVPYRPAAWSRTPRTTASSRVAMEPPDAPAA